jgi:hypothetical protein
MGTTQLLSVPYALYANSAGSTTGSTGGFIHYVGELFGGGIVVSVWKDAQGVEHGLIASLTDLSAGIPWTTPAFQNVAIGPSAQSLKDGLANTNAIVAQAGAGTTYAAGLCKAYNAGGFTDWYLPAVNELKLCYNSLPIVNEILDVINGFQASGYWSSTEGVSNYASYQFFPNGLTRNGNKDGSYVAVRAVRRF